MAKKRLRKLSKIRKRSFPFLLGMLIILAPVVAWSLYNTKSAKAAWYDYSWTKRKSITVTNNGSQQSNYNVQLIINTQTLISAGQMQSDCDDARFTTTAGVLLSHFYEAGCNTTKTSFWVQIPTVAVGSNSLYMYFGNGSATSVSAYLSPVGSINYGIGTDGDISFSTDKNINVDNQISGRSCADGGDAVNYSVTANTSSGQNQITLSSTPASGCLATGDEVLIINLMGTSGANSDVGEWETARISSISTATLTLNHNLVNGYDGTTQKIMVQRVPNYNDVTISTASTDFIAADYNGTKGGVMMFRADGTVSIAASTTINVNSLGYRGGTAGSGGAVGGSNGESYDGTVGSGGSSTTAGTSGGGDAGGNALAAPSGAVRGGGGGGGSSGGTSSANGGGGGGGGGNGYGGGGGGGSSDGTNNNAGDGGAAGTTSTNGGGGGGGVSGTGTAGNGGAAGSAGSQGGTNANGGAVGSGTTSGGGGGGANNAGGSGGGGGGGGSYGSSTLTNIYMGSGGGGGGDSVVSGTGGNGGDGAGIIYIGANTLTVSGGITATGANGTQATANAGSGGSGAGGSIYISAATSTLGSSLVTAAGGAVVADTTDVAGAGAGGSGRIYNVYSSTSGTTSPTATSSAKPVFSSEGSTENQPTEAQLAAHWKFDEGNGTTAYDSTTNDNDGTLAGSTLPTWESKNSCYKNRCLLLDGSTSSVTVAQTVSLVRSVSMWVRPTDVSSAALIDLNGTARVTVSSGTISATGFDTPTIYVDGIATTTLEAGKWQHVVVTTATSLSASAIELGNYSTTYLKGFIDETKIFTSTLTAAEVKAEFAGGAVNLVDKSSNFLGNGIVGYWTFNHTSGNASDKSGYATTLTNNNTATYVSSKYGNGTDLNGTTQYFDAADNSALSLTGSLSISTWIEPDDTTGSQDIVGKFDQSNESYLLALEGDEVRMYIDSSSNYATTTAADIQANTKTMITAVYNSANQTVQIYVNDALKTSSVTGTIPASIGDDAGKFAVGAEDTTGTPANHFDGTIDDVRIYNKTLTAQEIIKLFNSGPGPVAYYNMDSAVSLITESGGLQFDGTEDFVEVPTTVTVKNLTQFSISAWFWTSNLDSTRRTIYEEKRGGGTFTTRVKLAIDTDNKLLFGGRYDDSLAFANWVDSTTVLSEDTWYHVVAVFDSVSDTHYVYVNNSSESASVAVTSISNTDPSGPSAIGALKTTDATTEAEWYDGRIREVAIYNTALTSGQVSSLYTSGVSLNNSNLVAYYPLDEESGQIAYDDKNSYNATLGDDSNASSDDPTWLQFVRNGSVPDVSGYSNTGTVTNYINKVTGAGKFGKALLLDGSSQYMEAADSASLSITGDLSVSSWIKPAANTAATEYTIAGKWDATNKSYLLQQYGDEIRMYIGSANNYVTTNSVNLTTNNWYHVEGVYNASAQSVKIYVNGAQQTTTTTGTIPTSISDSSNKLYLGALNTEGSGAASLDLTVAASSDDAMINEAVYNDNATTMSLGGVSTTPLTNFGQGFRFNNVTVPKGASVTSAYMTFTKNGAEFIDTHWRLTAIDEDDTATFSSGSPPGSRAITSSYIAAQDLNVSHTDGTAYSYPTTGGVRATLGSAIGAVVNRSGWSSGNDLAIVNNSDQDAGARQTFGRESYRTYDFGTPATNAPKLHIDYEVLDVQSGPFSGSIDDVKIYNYARSDTQVLEDLNGDHPAGGSPISSKIAHYKFDEGYGTTANNSNPQLSSLTGSVSGASWFVQDNCKFANCLDFDGSDDVTTVTNAASIDFDEGLASALTISAWINPDSDGENDQGQIFYKGTNTWCRTDSESGGFVDVECSLDLATTDATVNISQAVATNTWSHFSVGYTNDDDDEITVYINGVSVGSSTNGVGGPATSDSNNLVIGGTTTNNFDGSIDDFKIYSTQLTASQILIDKNSGSALSSGQGTREGSNLVDGAGTVPIGWWPMDENTGTSSTYDKSGNNNTGTLNGSMTASDWVRGKKGSALDFDGTDDYINIYSATLGSAFSGSQGTVMAWIKVPSSVYSDNTTRRAVFLSSNTDNAVSIYKNSTNQLTLQYEAATVADSYNVSGTPTDWTHLAMTWNNTTDQVIYYVNGVHVETDVGDSDWAGSLDSVRANIGDQTTTSSQEWLGLIDDVKIYNYARTPGQIAQDSNRGTPVGWWKFDECTGTTANDSGGAVNSTGTWSGASGANTGAGTCTGASGEAWYSGSNGKLNASLDFDGTDDVVTVTNTNDLDFDIGLTKGVSFAAWIFAGSDGENDVGEIFNKGTTTYCRTDTQGTTDLDLECSLNLSTTAATLNITDALTTNTWHHIVMTYSDDADDEITVYVDGINKGSSSNGVGSPAVTDSSNLLIGGSSSANFDGQIDDFRVYTYEISSTQIKQAKSQAAIKFSD